MHCLMVGLLKRQMVPCWVCPPGGLQLIVVGPNKGWTVHGSMLQDWERNTSGLPQNTGCYAVDVGTHRVSWCKNPWGKEEAWIYLQFSFKREFNPWIDQIHQQDISLRDRLASWEVWIFSSSASACHILCWSPGTAAPAAAKASRAGGTLVSPMLWQQQDTVESLKSWDIFV